MKLLTKNGYKFMTGMFWQIPDENKRSVNFSKIVKDTKHELYCQIDNIKPTWGFCRKVDLQGEKRVASLGKFIVESSNLTADYANSIICYKFKDLKEIDEEGLQLNQELYGYIILLNGTISPDEGEYVSEFEAIKESILQKARKYEIEALYLPVDVSTKFFNIFERLDDAFNSDDLLNKIMDQLNVPQEVELKEFINNNLPLYGKIFEWPLDINLLRKLIKEPAFEKHFKDIRDLNIKYLFSNIYNIPYTSDEIYWQSETFKKQFTKSLLKPVSTIKTNKVKVLISIILFCVSGYLGYGYIFNKKPLITASKTKPSIPKPVAVNPIDLINECLVPNNKFFGNLGKWLLVNIDCNSLGNKLNFNTDTDTTVSDFILLTGEPMNSSLNNKLGLLTQTKRLTSGHINNLNKDNIISQLQEAANNYKFQLNIVNTKNKVTMPLKFTIVSSLSPVYLQNQGILDNTLLMEIVGSLNKSTGYFTWTIQGEI